MSSSPNVCLQIIKFLIQRETESWNNSEISDWLPVGGYRNEWIHEQMHTLDVYTFFLFILLDRKLKMRIWDYTDILKP